jgi:hypothetical protein
VKVAIDVGYATLTVLTHMRMRRKWEKLTREDPRESSEVGGPLHC